MGQKRVQDKQIDFAVVPSPSSLSLTASGTITIQSLGAGADIKLLADDGINMIALDDAITISHPTQKIQFFVASNTAGWQIVTPQGGSSVSIPRGTLLPIFGEGTTAAQIGASTGHISRMFVRELRSASAGMNINASADITVSSLTGQVNLFGSDVTIAAATSSGVISLQGPVRLTDITGVLATDITAQGLQITSSANFIVNAGQDLTLFTSDLIDIRGSIVSISAVGAIDLKCGGIFTASAVGNIALRSSGTFFASANDSIDLAAVNDVQLRSAGTITASAVGNIAIRSSGTLFASANANIDLAALVDIIASAGGDITLNASNTITLVASDNNIIGVPADLIGFQRGTIATSDILAVWPISRAMVIPTQSALTAYNVIPAGSGMFYHIKHDSSGTASNVGTVIFASGALTGSVRFDASLLLAIGDSIYVQASAIPTSAITADVGVTIKARTS